VKLLLDQNLSFRLVAGLAGCFPGSAHVKDFGLTGDDDERIWNLAREQGFVIVTKDSDFLARALLRGHPPEVVQIAIGNSSTREIESLLMAKADDIHIFIADGSQSVFILR
jgi:predicted nuclease of predicted toxin-antitoxin system